MGNSTPIHVGPPTIERVGERTVWSVAISHSHLPHRLWYSIPVQYEEFLNGRLDPALLALTIPALHFGAPVHLEAPVADELFRNHAELQRIYLLAGHGNHPVDVVPVELARSTRAAGVATGFSAGIDSFAALFENFYAEGIPESQRLTHLLFNNVGSNHVIDSNHRDPSQPESMSSQQHVWRKRFEQARHVTDRIGLPLIDIDTNITAFYPPPIDRFEHSHTLRNASVAHLLSGGIGTWYYASAYQYGDLKVTEKLAAHSDPFTLPFMSSSSITLRPSGTSLRRVDKTALIAGLPEAQDNLDVCIRTTDGTNCSHCHKCLRTLAALEILGKLDQFATRFDLDTWQASSSRFFSVVLAQQHSNPFLAELVDLASEKGYKFSQRQIMGAKYLRGRRLLGPVEGMVKRILRALPSDKP